MSCCLVQRGWDRSWQFLWWFEDNKICFTAIARMRHFGPPRLLIPTSQCCLCSWQLLPLISPLLALLSSHSFGREEVEAAGVQMDAACVFKSFLWAAAAHVIPHCATLYCHSIANKQAFHLMTVLYCRQVDELRTRNGRWFGEETYY